MVAALNFAVVELVAAERSLGTPDERMAGALPKEPFRSCELDGGSGSIRAFVVGLSSAINRSSSDAPLARSEAASAP